MAKAKASWVVIQTKPRASAMVVKHLRQQGFEYYNPRTNLRLVSRGRVTFRRTQLFPDYIFVRVIDQWRALLSTLGVRRLLMSSDEKPAQIKSSIIRELQRAEDESGLVALGPKFKVGDKVQVKRGPFAYCTGLYDGQSDKDRSLVLLSWLGASRSVAFEEDNLIAA